MFLRRIRVVSLGLVLLWPDSALPLATANVQQAGITVHREQCQSDLEKTICTLAERLDSFRHHTPYWDAPFETDPTCDAVLLVLAATLGKSTPRLVQETLERILTWTGRTADGWATYPGGPYDHNTTAIILLSLQAVGMGREHPELHRAWSMFERMGGRENLTMTSRIFLDALGLYPHQVAPWISPKIVALSKVSPVNIFKLGILRSVIIPQIGLKYYAAVPKAQALQKALLKERGQLFGGVAALNGQTKTTITQHSRPEAMDYFTNDVLDAVVLNSNEFWAQEILAWTLRTQQADGTWYALASTINSILLLKAAQDKGVADFTPEIDTAWQGLMQLRRPSQQGPLFVQTIRSTVWDTANALSALLKVNKRFIRQPPDHWQHTTQWLLRSQYTARDMLPGGDGIAPKAWSFSHLDTEYLDSDDTAAALNALLETQRQRPAAHIEDAIRSAVAWLLQLQNEDGGFPSWNRGITKSFLKLMGTHFKDLVEVADVSQTDVTSRVLYVLQRLKDANILPVQQATLTTSIAQACTFLKRSATVQAEAKAPVWFGDWAINYVYATSFATTSLLHARCWTTDEALPAVQWIIKTQHTSGGWGESPESYQRQAYVAAPPTIFQTAAALFALIEYYERERETTGRQPDVRAAIDKGIAYLLTRTELGRHTHDDTYTAVAVKGQMFVQYYYAPTYFTLYVLSKWHKLQSTDSSLYP